MPRQLPRRLVRFFLDDPALFVRYISVGAFSAAVELALFALFYQAWGWPLLAANTAALSIALLVNFASHKGWTFRAAGGLPRQVRLYVLMQGISAVLNNGLIYLLIGHWHWYAPTAKVVQIGLVFAWNFTFCRLIVFAAKPAAGGRQV